MTEFNHLVPDDVVLRRIDTPRILHCYCCKDPYPQGQFKCCAPPTGMAGHTWLEQRCPAPPTGCGKCPRHCLCPKAKPAGPLAQLAEKFLDNWGR